LLDPVVALPQLLPLRKKLQPEEATSSAEKLVVAATTTLLVLPIISESSK
jgi:hypothetical protein